MTLGTTPRPEMAKAYNPAEVEDRLYQFWLDGGWFAPDMSQPGEPFCVIQPPPNVTGELHQGHALVAALSDTLVRWRRMKGQPTLWLPGEDHASIAAQWVMEQQLAREGTTRQALGRERFLERMWQWMDTYRPIIGQQHRKLGVSCDWSRERFTMDPGPSHAVATTFNNYFQKGLVYRGFRIINWCPRCETALSDLEVDHDDGQGALYYVKYPLKPVAGQPDFLLVATTRPETILGDTALAVNPNDPRYGGFVGRTAIVPGVDREIPVLADEAVDIEFGTGALKITPAHDPVDFEVGQRHKLPVVVAMNLDATMNENAGPYAGLSREDARKAVVRDLEAAGRMDHIDTDYMHAVGRCYRCKTVVEPMVSEQWWLNVQGMAKDAVAAVESGRISFVPERFTKVFYNWMENIRDWCISRQLWWGHRIPAWYCGACDGARIRVSFEHPLNGIEGGSYAELRAAGLDHQTIVEQATRMTIGTGSHPIVAVEAPAACPTCGHTDLVQDPDVFDTWFSSGLWPHSTLGWPADTEDLRAFYPSSVMITAYDILFFWVARMAMMGLENTGEVPFRTVYLHGLVRDDKGEKMSKSKGNVISPNENIASHGTDALRFTLATGSTPGNDMKLSAQRLDAGRNFANKLWNASRFVLSNLPEAERVNPADALSEGRPAEDRWIISRLHHLMAAEEDLLSNFQLGEAGRQIHDFLWNEYCDWYIEVVKVRLRAGDTSPHAVLAYVLDNALRLLHPFMPFVTEEIWQSLKPRLAWTAAEPPALMVAPYPQADPERYDDAAEDEMETMIDVVRAVRNARAERGVEPARLIQAVAFSSPAVAETLRRQQDHIKLLARLEGLDFQPDSAERPAQSVPLVLDRCEVYLPLAGLLDLNVERQKLEKELTQERTDIERLSAKLGNDGFVAKAPADVVAKERERLEAAKERAGRLEARLATLAAD